MHLLFLIKFNSLIYKEYRYNIWFILDIFQQIQLAISFSEVHYALEYYLTENWDTKFLEKKWLKERLEGIAIKENFCIKRRFGSLTIITTELLIYARHFSVRSTYISQFYNLQNTSFNHLEKEVYELILSPFFRWTKLKSCASCLRSHRNNCEKQNTVNQLYLNLMKTNGEKERK